MDLKVNFVERVHEVEVTDGFWIAKFKYDRDLGKIKTTFRGCYKSRCCEPVYIPKAIFAAFVRRAYAVFYGAKKIKMRPAVSSNQLWLNL